MNRFVTAASAVAIALTSFTATPAAAQSNGDRDALALVLGLAAIGVIAHQADKNRDKDKDKDKDNSNYYYDDRNDGRHNSHNSHNGRDDRDDWRNDNRHDNRGAPRVDRRKLIPEHCVVQARVNGRSTNVVSEQCFRRARGASLPGACEFEIRTNRGRQEVFGMNCLRDRGFRVVRS
jgi:hypothetical protein